MNNKFLKLLFLSCIFISLYGAEQSFYMCKFEGCKKSYSAKNSLQIHSKIHSGQAFKCGQCTYITPFKCDLQKHLMLHSEDKIYKCDWEDCGKAFKRKDYLKRHKLTHEPENIYKCEFRGCRKTYITQYDLNAHLKVHSKEAFKCEQCDYVTNFKRYLKNHMLVHSEDRPFKCNWEGCRFAAKSKSGLKSHGKTHTKKIGVKFFEDPQAVHEISAVFEGQGSLNTGANLDSTETDKCYEIYDLQQFELGKSLKAGYDSGSLLESDIEFNSLSELVAAENNKKRSFDDFWPDPKEDFLFHEAKRSKVFEEEI